MGNRRLAPTSALTASPTNWLETSVLAVFSAGSGVTGTFTVAMNGTHTVAGIYNGALANARPHAT